MKLKEYRLKFKLTQKQVGELINKTATGYGYYESGKNEPDLTSLITLAKFYHTTTDELLGVSQPDLLNKNLLSTEERNIVDNLPNLSRDNLMKVEAYVFAKLEEQKSNK